MAINETGFSMTNCIPHHENQELLAMMEANGQYPLVDDSIHQSNPTNGHINGNVNENMDDHMNGDCDMQEDQNSHSQRTIQNNGCSSFNQTPSRCMRLCGHLQ
jgi:hypothetical protein